MPHDQTVSWTSYAAKYDMLMQHNPFYQQLHEEVISHTSDWEIDDGDIILDLGAGTGNYSCALAERFPQARVIHIDLDEGMNREAAIKKERRGLVNLEILGGSVYDLVFEPNTIKAVTGIHCLYTFPSPHLLLQRISEWLKPSGYGVFVDPGRIVNVLDWQVAIGTRMIRKYGLRKTLEIMKEGKEVSKQNREISKLQKNGTYWTHSHKEFVDAVEHAGFEVVAEGLTFRKLSDWTVVTKS